MASEIGNAVPDTASASAAPLESGSAINPASANMVESSVDEELRNAEKLVQEIDQLVSQSTPAAPSSQASSSTVSPSDSQPGSPDVQSSSQRGLKSDRTQLIDLDKSLASQAEQILRSEPDAVNAVLDEVFDEQATLVQHVNDQHAHPPQPKPREKSAATRIVKGGAEQPATPAGVDVASPSAASSESVPSVPSSSPAPTSQMPTLSTASAANSDPQPIPSAAEASVTIAADSPGATSQPSAFAAAATPAASVSNTEPSSNSEATIAIPQPLTQSSRSAPMPNGVVRALLMINQPWVRASKQTRTLLNWVAISMLAWVPIVWLVLMLTHGKAETSNNHSPETSHADAVAPH